ncbi:MAG: hypothetical protein Q4C70_01945 [Planctomycetia bacterium]|nr:hypothetical protein [Planctomycetia bacterium]
MYKYWFRALFTLLLAYVHLCGPYWGMFVAHYSRQNELGILGVLGAGFAGISWKIFGYLALILSIYCIIVALYAPSDKVFTKLFIFLIALLSLYLLTLGDTLKGFPFG